MSKEPAPTVRYCLQNDIVGYTVFDKEKDHVDETTSLRIVATKKRPVFLDILTKVNAHIWEVKLYYPDGTIVKSCFIYPHIFDSIKIHNFHLLFDGRFNS